MPEPKIVSGGWSSPAFWRDASIEDITRCLSEGLDITATSVEGSSLLSMAVGWNNHEAVKGLLAAGVDVNAKGYDGETPLLIATMFGDREMLGLLLAHNADVALQDCDGNTPLHRVAMYGNLGMIGDLLDHGASLEAENSQGRMALHVAAWMGKAGAIKLLVSKGANLEAQGSGGETPLITATQSLRAETAIKALLGEGADIDGRETAKERGSPLANAAFRGCVTAVEVLLGAGANPNDVYTRGRSVLHIAVEGIFPSSINGRGDIYERRGRSMDIVRALIKAKACVNAQDDHGGTALHYAVAKGETDIVKALLDGGADPNARDGKGNTPLHYGAQTCFSGRSPPPVEMLAMLVAAGADINSQNDAKCTPLHWGAQFGAAETVKRLLDAGADATLLDDRGYAARHYAEQQWQEDICNVFVDAGVPLGEPTEGQRSSKKRPSNQAR